MRQRGFGYVELIICIAVLGIVAAIVITVRHWVVEYGESQFSSGAASVQAKWDKAKLESVALERARNEEVGVALDILAKNVASAEAKAVKHESNFEEAKREARRLGIALDGCSIEGQDPAPNRAARGVAGVDSTPGIRAPGVASAAPHTRLTWEFVRQFDGGWTGLDGKPVSEAPARGEGAERAGPFAPYSLADAVDVAGENAISCSADRRSLDALIRSIRAASTAWEAASKGGDRDTLERAAAP